MKSFIAIVAVLVAVFLLSGGSPTELMNGLHSAWNFFSNIGAHLATMWVAHSKTP